MTRKGTAKSKRDEHVPTDLAEEDGAGSLPQPSPTRDPQETRETGSDQPEGNTADQVDDEEEEEEEEAAPAVDEKTKARLAKLAQLRAKIDESAKANRQDVYAEHQKKKENPREILRAARKREQAEYLLGKKTAEEDGVDFERKEMLKYSAEDVERWEQKRKEKAERAETGFTDYAQIAAKKYNKQIKELKPNIAVYEEQKSLAAVASSISSNRDESDFYRDANSMSYASLDNRPDAEAVDRLVNTVNDQIASRAKFSRRRLQREDDDISYINERNMRFNKKIARAFDKYTGDIKASFERGTALD
ncbi:SYF2 splicing factor-domain-containing protein [Hyaloraphidium curvatum]|nr:SYF2 splicing factor-domain-containing protein [Hyaloraphidium curvatum]